MTSSLYVDFSIIQALAGVRPFRIEPPRTTFFVSRSLDRSHQELQISLYMLLNPTGTENQISGSKAHADPSALAPLPNNGSSAATY